GGVCDSAVSSQRSAVRRNRPASGGCEPLGNFTFQGVDTPRSPGVALYMQLVGANSAAQPAGLDALPGKANYFIGNDPTKWHTDISTFGRVAYQDVYPGIDLAYYGSAQASGQLEYDFIVNAGAEPGQVELHFAGADKVSLDPNGDLVVEVGGMQLRQAKPTIY